MSDQSTIKKWDYALSFKVNRGKRFLNSTRK